MIWFLLTENQSILDEKSFARVNVLDVIDRLQGVSKLLLVDAVDDKCLLIILKLSCKIKAVVVKASV